MCEISHVWVGFVLPLFCCRFGAVTYDQVLIVLCCVAFFTFLVMVMLYRGFGVVFCAVVSVVAAGLLLFRCWYVFFCVCCRCWRWRCNLCCRLCYVMMYRRRLVFLSVSEWVSALLIVK